jgi:hypothetical protein
VSSAVGE